jgi:hypothetical protein
MGAWCVFNSDGASDMSSALREKNMKTNRSVAMNCMRGAFVAVTVMLVGRTALIAEPSGTAEESVDGARTPPPASARWAAYREQEITLACHERQDSAAPLSPRDARAQAAPGRRLQLEIAGLDLLARGSDGFRPAALSNAQAAPFASGPAAHVVGPLRWTWASVTWKF